MLKVKKVSSYNLCDNCLNSKKDEILFQYDMACYGRVFKIILCRSCLNKMGELSKLALHSDKAFQENPGLEMQQNYLPSDDEDWDD